MEMIELRSSLVQLDHKRIACGVTDKDKIYVAIPFGESFVGVDFIRSKEKTKDGVQIWEEVSED